MVVRICALAALCFLAGAAIADEPGQATMVPLDPKPGVYPGGEFSFTLVELPRAGGKAILVGSLSKDGSPVAGGDYYRLELPVGSFIWYPPTEGQMQVGWTRINPGMKHSHWQMVEIAAKKNTQGHWVTQPEKLPELPVGPPLTPVPPGTK